MKYKLIVSDFDGTLLRSDNTVSAKTVEAIERYERAGGIFTVSTGRSFESINNRLPELGIKGRPVMALQGSYCACVGGEVLFKEYLDFDVFKRFSQLVDNALGYWHVYTDNEIFTKYDCDFSREYSRLTGVKVNTVKDPAACVNEKPIKILSIVDAKDTERLNLEWGEIIGGSGVVFTSSPIFIECISPRAGKGNGVKRVAEKLGIDISEVAAIGDEMNDYSMVQAAGLGAAVGNARENLKRAADMVFASNDEDGVRQLIEYCLEE